MTFKAIYSILKRARLPPQTDLTQRWYTTTPSSTSANIHNWSKKVDLLRISTNWHLYSLPIFRSGGLI